MRERLRKALRWLFLPLALLVVILVAAVGWLVGTEAGLARAVALVESLAKYEIRIEGARGRLVGPLSIDRIAIEHPRARIRIESVTADYEPFELLAGRLSADGLRVATADVVLRGTPGPAREPSFMARWLALDLDDAAIGRLRIVTRGGAELPLQDVSGSAHITRLRLAFEDVRARAPAWAVSGADGELLARTPIAVNATADWSLGAERQVTGNARATGDLDRLQVEAGVATPGAGRARLVLRGLNGPFTFDGEVAIERLDLRQWLEEPPFGPLAGTFAVRGDRARYAAAGALHGDGLPPEGVRVEGEARYGDRVVTFDRIALEAAPLAATLAGELRLGEGSGTPEYEARAEWTRLRWPLVGEVLLHSSRGTLDARGWREFDYAVAGDFTVPGAPPFAARANGRFAENEIVVDHADLAGPLGRVLAAGSLARQAPRAWRVAGRARDVDPSAVREGLEGSLEFEFAASGTDFGAGAALEASVRNLEGRFRGQPASGSGTVRRGDDGTEFERVELALGPARLSLHGAWGARGTLDARLVADDLSAFLPELDGRVNATVTLRDRSLAIGVTGHDLAWGRHRAVILSLDAQVDREGQEHSYARLRSNGLTVGGFPVNDTRLSLDGLVQDHAMGLRIGAGEDALVLRGRGAWANDRYTLTLEQIAASGPRLPPWRLEAPSRLTASAREAGIEPLCLFYAERRLCLEGRWHATEGWRAAARTAAFPLEALAADRPGKPSYRGLLSLEASASGEPGRPWVADVRAEIRDASLKYLSASGAERTVALGLTQLTATSNPDLHRVELNVSEASDFNVAVRLRARRVPGRDFGELPLRGTVKGATRQLRLLPLLLDSIDDTSGEASLDFDVAGQVAAPRLTGVARVRDGTLDVYPANLRLRDIDATAHLADTGLQMRAHARAGEGSLEINGRLGWEARRLHGRLALRGERLLVANVPEARVFASPDLQFTINDRRIDVTGGVTLPEARIRPADTAGAVLVSADERIVTPESPAEDGPAFDVHADLRLTLGDAVTLDAYGLKGTVTGSVRAQTGEDTTLATGELEVVDGEYRAYTRELEVERGRLVFTGGPVTDPAVDLRASREVPPYRVGVIARGPLRQPQLTLFSEPPLPQSQIASMLVVGRQSIQGDEASSQGSPSLATGGGALLAGQIGRRVGLDEVGIAQDPSAGTALVIGKYLSPRLYVSYGISLVDQINTLKLRYTIGDRWVISAESGRESAADIEYRIED